MKIIITKHAAERARKRAGLKRRSLERLTPRIFKKGLSLDNAKTKSDKYLLNKLKSDHGWPVIYGGFIYIFLKSNIIKLVTIIPNKRYNRNNRIALSAH